MSTPVSSSTSSNSLTNTQQTTNQTLIQQLLNEQQRGPAISFGGLISGIDTKAIVDAMMQAEQLPILHLQNQQAGEQARLAAWQDFNTRLQSLQAAASTLGLAATTAARKVTFAGPSGTFATATANSGAATGTFQLEIGQLATNTKAVSTAGIGAPVISSDIMTFNMKLATNITPGTFTVNGNTISITAGESFGALFTAISTATGGTVSGSIVNNQVVFQSNNGQPVQLGSGGDTSNFLAVTKLAGQPIALTVTSGGPVGVASPSAKLNASNINGLTSTTSGSLLVNGVSITYNTATDSLSDVIKRINSSAANVSAFYDQNSDTVTFTSSKTGNIDITLSDSAGNLLSSLNVTSAGAHQLGQSAMYKVNGGTAQYSLSNSVANLVPGVNVTLQAVTPAGQPLSTSVSLDTTVGATAIQALVTAYNSVADFIEQATAYDPESKVAGIFLGEPALSTVQQQLVGGLFQAGGTALGLTAGFTDLSTIGVSTGAVGSLPGTTTKLQFDQAKFEAAMSQNAGAAGNLVTKIFSQFSQLALDLTSPFGVIDSAIQSETDQVIELQHRIDAQSDLLKAKEAILNQQFTALEQALAQIRAQSSAGASVLTQLSSIGR